MAFKGQDLRPLTAELIQRAQDNPHDANALMDLATVLELNFKPDIALATQAQALQMQTLYHLPAKGEPALRLLALMAPGDLTTNAPLSFLLEAGAVSLDMLYIGAGPGPLPPLPAHDVLFVAMGESEATHPLLEALVPVVDTWPKPVLNLPGRILRTSRDASYALLQDAPGIVMPSSVRIERADLDRLGRGECGLKDWLPGADFPVIVRPVDSHAGHGLAKLDGQGEVAGYLASLEKERFFISPFVDYRGTDGLYRKYRVVLIGGRPFAGHMGISSHWMIHYLNAGMDESTEKRGEEAHFMETFEEGFARRHAYAIQTINERLGLDYLVIDCAESASGELLIFEVDTGAVVHDMDPPDLFPYKVPAMQKVFTAFRGLLEGAVHGGVFSS
jgi:hypothetical protein